jgi:hypothetical protein
MPEQSRGTHRGYSTGFRLYLAGWAIVGLAALLSTQVWKPLFWLGVLGLPGLWFKYPSDWRKRWPEDFPIASSFVGRAFRDRRLAR